MGPLLVWFIAVTFAVLVGACGDDAGPAGALDGAAADLPQGADAGVVQDTFTGEALPRATLVCTPGADGNCPPCVERQRGCASGAEVPIDGTCCQVGDALEALGQARGSEVVDVESDGTYAIACGGFGADISDIRDPRGPTYLGSASKRCQRVAFGAKTPKGRQIFYLAHHGDSWVSTPFLATYTVDASGIVANVDIIEDKNVLFEGLAYHPQGFLYVAAHGGGVRVYRLAESGKPELVKVIGGLGNAWKVALDVIGKRAFVADQQLGLVVLDIAKPSEPSVVVAVPTTAPPRDVVFDARSQRVILALGGGGVDLFDLPVGGAPTLNRTLAGRGSAQAVAVGDGILAVAAWNHLAVYDALSLAPLAMQRTRRAFEQDLGVAVVPSGVAAAGGAPAAPLIIVGEWEGLHTVAYRQGLVGPRLWIDDDIITLDPARPDAALIVHNLGLLPLKVRELRSSDGAFTSSKTSLSIAPGGRDSFEVRGPSGGSSQAQLTLFSDDPDPQGAQRRLPVAVSSGSRLDVGDKLGSEFGFLDPSGAGQLSGLQGKVIVLAYFALF